MEKKKSNILHKVIMTFIATSLLFTLIISLWGTRLFEVREIVITGNNRVQNSEVIKRSGIRAGLSTMFFLESRAKRELLNSPWISDVKIVKEFPNKVLINIEELDPFCLLIENGESKYLNKNGKVLGSANLTDGYDYPSIVLEGRFPQDLIEEALIIMKLSKSSTFLNWDEISEISVDKKYGIKLLTTDKRQIDFGSGNIVSKWNKVERIIDHSRNLNLNEQYINISTENKGIVKFNIL